MVKKGIKVKKEKGKYLYTKYSLSPTPCVVRDRESDRNPRINPDPPGVILGFSVLSLSLTTHGGSQPILCRNILLFNFFTVLPFLVSNFFKVFYFFTSKFICVKEKCVNPYF